MQYLRIASPGIADPLALTIMGIGTSRYSTQAGTIGQFASGSKLAAGLLLRNALPPTIITGNLRMNYQTKEISVSGRNFQQVVVKYQGQDINGKNRSTTEDLGYTLEWGEADWFDVTMAPREYVANAIDAVTQQKLDFTNIEISLVDSIRAKKDWTQVYIPASDEIVNFLHELNLRFLHFDNKKYLTRKCLPKLVSLEPKTRIFKKGVLVSVLDQPSVWDYNLGDELKLDESRNASEHQVKYAIAKALAHADKGTLAVVMKALSMARNKVDLLEASLSTEYLKDAYDDETKDKRKEIWKEAFESVAGKAGVASTGLPGLASHLEAKGYVPFLLPQNWVDTLSSMDCQTEDKVLSKSERSGEVLSEASSDMIKAVDEIWELLLKHDLTNGKEKPKVKGFQKIMDAGRMKRGEYRDGVVLLHVDLSQMCPLLREVALEEIVHHVTGAADFSRDIQSFLFKLVIKMNW
jgi:hypothetical protein